MSGQDSLDIEKIKKLTPFTTLSESHLQDIRRKGSLDRFEKGKILFKRDEPGGRLHYVISGAVDLADANFDITPVSATSDRARSALDPNDPHTVTAVTTSSVQVFSVPKDYVDLVLTWDQAGNYVVTDLSAGETLEVEKDWMSSLLASAMFAAIPPANIQQLFARFEEMRYKAGDVVVKQGEPGDYFYAVKAGTLQISRRVSTGGEVKEMPLAKLGAGDVFGEDALIGDAPRNATVTMLTDGTLMRLGQEDFQSLLENPVVEELTYEELMALMKDSSRQVEILDVRLPLEFKQGSIPGSRNLPLHVLRQQLDELADGTLYVVTCDGGRRSVLAAYILAQEGLEAAVLKNPPVAESNAA